MIKELFLAIALGAILGFGITGGFLTLNKNKETSTQKNTDEITVTPIVSSTITSTELPTPTSQLQNSNSLIIDNPEDQSIVNNSKLNIKGVSIANSVIIVKTPVKAYNTLADSEGSFSIDVELESGVNSIEITSVDPQTDQTSESNLLITYSTAKI